MAIVTDTTRRIAIPHEPNEWLEVRRLSWRQLEMAAEVQTESMLKRLKAMGGDLVKALQKAGKEQEQDPTAKYDRGTVLQAGIIRWSYSAETTKANIDALDEETAAWAFKEILALNNPRTEEERKNA